MTRLMNPGSPATTNSLWPLIPIVKKDLKAKFSGNIAPEKQLSPRIAMG